MRVNFFALQHMGALLERYIRTDTMRVFHKAYALLGNLPILSRVLNDELPRILWRRFSSDLSG